MVGRGLLVVAVSLGFAATTQACWYPYDAEDCFIAYQGVETECEASYEFLSTFVVGVRIAQALALISAGPLCGSGTKQTPHSDVKWSALQLDGIFAPASSAANDTNGICLLYSPYSCAATYTSYLKNGGNGVNATYPACPADTQTVLRAWIEAGAFEDSG